MGLTPAQDGAPDEAGGAEDWFSTYPSGAAATEAPGTSAPCLSPLLTPSGAQLGAALVDAF